MSLPSRRSLVWLAAGVLALPVLALLVLWLPPVQRLLVTRALDAIRDSANLDIDAARIRFSPARLTLVADDLRIAAVGADAPLLRAEQIEIDIAYTVLTSRGQDITIQSVRLTSPTLLLRRDREGRWNLPASDPGADAAPLPRVTLRNVAVADATVLVDDQVTGHRLAVDDLTLTSTDGPIHAAGTLALASGGRTLDGTTDVTFTYDGDVIGIEQADIRLGRSQLQADGDYSLRDTGIDFSTRLQLAVADLAPLAGLSDATGRLDAMLRLSGTTDRPTATWTLTGRAISDGRLPPVEVDAKGSADASTLQVEALDARVAGGRLAAKDLVVALSDADTTRIAATLERLGLGAIADAYALPIPLTGQLDATVSAEGPGLDWTAWRSALRVEVRGTATSGAITVPLDGRIVLRSAERRWTANADVASQAVGSVAADLSGALAADLAQSTLNGAVRVRVDDIEAALARLGAPVTLGGDVSVDARVTGTLADARASWSLDGSLATPLLTSPVQVAARGTASPDLVMASALSAVADGSRLDGTLQVRLAGDQRLSGRLHAELPALETLVAADAIGGWPVSGSATLDARLAGSLTDPIARIAVDAATLAAAGQRIDTFASTATWQDATLTLADLVATAGEGRATGHLSLNVDRRDHTASLTIVGWPVRPVPAAAAPRDPGDAPLPVNTTIAVVIDTRGRWDKPIGTAHLDATRVHWAGHPLGDLSLEAASDGRQARADFAAPALTATGQATLTLAGDRRFAVEARLADLSLDPFRPWLPDGWSDVQASLVADVAAAGDIDQIDDSLEARATFEQFTAGIGGASLALAAPARVSISRAAIEVDGLSLRTGDLTVAIDGALARSRPAAGLTLAATGPLAAARPWASALSTPLPDLVGALSLRVQVLGSLAAPEIGGTLSLRDASVGVAGSPLTLPAAQAALANGVLTLEQTTLHWREASAVVDGVMPLRWLQPVTPEAAWPWLGQASGPARLRASADALSVSLLEPWLGRDALAGVSGVVSARLDAAATSPALADVDATMRLDQARVTVQGIDLRQAHPSVASLAGGRVTVDNVLLTGANTDLAFDADALLTGDAPTVDARMRGLTDLALLRPLLADSGIAPAGRAEIDLHAVGPLTAPDLTGQLILTDAALRVAEPRLAVEQINGTLTFSGRQMTLSSVEGLANGAPLTVTGGLSLDADNQPTGRLLFRADGVPLEYPEGLRIEADVDVAAAIAGRRIDVTGDVAVLRGIYRDPIALSALSTSLLTGDTVVIDTGDAGSIDVRFGIDIETRDDILVDNNYGRLAAGASLRLLGTLETPALSGRITVREGGELYLSGLTYRVERGAVDFINPTRIEPIVDLAAETRAGGERIRIEATGSPETLEVTLSAPEASEPRSQAELASLLVSGQDLDDLSGSAAGQQALALLSADLFGVIGQELGLDAIRLDRDLLLDERASTGEADVAAETDPVARLTLVKRLRSNVEVLYSQNLRDASAITWLVTWKPFRRTEARLLQRDDRSMSYEFRHEIVFGAPSEPSRSRPTEPEVASVTLTIDDNPTLHDPLTRRLHLEAGDRFNFYRWQEDRDRLARWLYQQQYYEHRVRARREVADGADGPTVALTYDVQAGPRATLDVQGVTLDEDVLDRMRAAWQGSVFDGFLAADLTRIAREAMLRRGHPMATVGVESRRIDEGRAKVTTVTVDPGPALTTELATDGVPAALQPSFATWLDSGAASQAWLDPEALASRARDWLHAHGALQADVAISPPEVRSAAVVRTLRVDEGEVFTLARVELAGPVPSRIEPARHQLGLSSGAAFEAERLALAIRDLERWYLSQGFRTVDVGYTTDVDLEAREVRLTVEIAEGPRAVITATHIDGREHTQVAILERALALPVGAAATPTSLLTARKRLYDTGVVASADIRVDDLGDVAVAADGTRVQPVAITGVVRELPRLRFRYGLAVNDDVLQDDALRATASRRVTPGLSALLEHRNLFGRAIVTGISGRYERARQTGRTFLTSPMILGYDARLQASAGIARSRLSPDTTDSPIDLRTDVSVGVTQGLPGLEGLRLTYGYRYERSRTYDPKDPDVFDITITAPRLTSTAFIDRRDDPVAPTRGWFHASTVELSRSWVGSDFEFVKYYAQQSAFRSVGDVVLAGRAQVGVGRGFGQQNLIGSERFSAGGAVSVRGYGESVIGEVDPILGIARGDALMVLNGEVRLPIWRWISGVGFVDAGGVYPRIADLGWGGLQWGAGAGVRVSTPAGLVRLDLGLPIARRPIDKAWRVYLGLGQIF